MQRSIEELKSELIQLGNQERLEIARFLLFLDSHHSDAHDIDSSWEMEIKHRVHAVDDGTAVGIDYDDALRQLRAQFTQ